jgi:hypothetical protein
MWLAIYFLALTTAGLFGYILDLKDEHRSLRARWLSRMSRLNKKYQRAASGDGKLSGFWKAHSAWSQATFGSDSERGPIGPLKHLAKEAVEAQEKPDDLEEYADCLFLTFDATRRAGFTLEQLTEACFKKLEKNKKRKWGPATKDGAVEHDRSGE